MLEFVVDRFLRDPVKMEGVGCAADADRTAGMKTAFKPVQSLHLESQIFEGSFQAARLQLHGTKSAGERERLRDPVLYKGIYRRRLFRFAAVLQLQLVAQRHAQAGNSGEILAESIVQIAADPVF